MKTHEGNPQDWYLLASERLQDSDALFSLRGASYGTVELLQEAVERYLKGYLIAKGWHLRYTHNLVDLIEAAEKYDVRFGVFDRFAIALTQQFFLQHYPGNDLTDVGSDYHYLRTQTDELVALIFDQP